MGLKDELKLDEVEETSFDNTPMPDGEYLLIVEETEQKLSNSGNGEYIKIQCSVLAPEKYENRKVWHYFNVNNINEKTQNIGRAQLKSFLIATDLENADEHAEFVGASFLAKLKISKGTGGYDDSNKIVSFKAVLEREKIQEKVLSGGII